MNIVTVFNGKQKNFHMYWLPLIYKHQEVMFYIQAPRGFIYPKDIKNLKVNEIPNTKGPTLKCEMSELPTYRAMEVLTKQKNNWTGTPKDLDARFYEV